MHNRNYKSDIYLFLAAIIWGFSFVAQRAGMEHIGPFTFNGIRFALGSLSLVPLLFIRKEKGQGIELSRQAIFAGIAACSIYSLVTAICIEEIIWSSIVAASIPIIYGGVFSVGIAYTLQVIGQRKAHPSSASIILSLEAVFAVFGGWLLLNEMMSPRGLLGCGFMLMGMILAKVSFNSKRHFFNKK